MVADKRPGAAGKRRVLPNKRPSGGDEWLGVVEKSFVGHRVTERTKHFYLFSVRSVSRWLKIK